MAILLLAIGIKATFGHKQLDCSNYLSSHQRLSIKHVIESNAVVLFGLEEYRCTMAAEEALLDKGVCFKKKSFSGINDSTLKYLKCLHADSIGSIDSANGKNMWHSYLYVGGKYVGDGFKATQLNSWDNAAVTCHRSCNGILKPTELADMKRAISTSPVALYGWGGCPCTNIARTRFSTLGVCFTQNVW
jgi:hypothetical protein